MKRFILAIAIMAFTLSSTAQTKKSTTTKKTSTTATTKKTTTSSTAKKTTTKSSSTATKKTTSTAAKKPATSTTAKKTTTTTSTKTSTTTNNKPAATTTQSAPVRKTETPVQQNSSLSQSKGLKPASSHANEGWNEVYHYFGPSFYHASETNEYTYVDEHRKKTYSCTGVAFKFTTGYNRAFPISQKMPLYLRAGASLTIEAGKKNFSDMYKDNDVSLYSDDSYNSDDEVISAYMFSANINVDCCYKMPLGKYTLMPYVGADMKLNLAGHASNPESINLFNKKDTDGCTIHRIQGGAHLGADMFLNEHLALGMAFQYYTPLINEKTTHEDSYSKSMNQFKISNCSLLLKAAFVW